MGADLSNAASDGKIESEVFLNVYDLTPMNHYTYWFGFGVFHTGIEVHGKEYGFGAHEYPISGVFEVEPKRCPGFVFRCSVSLGWITMDSSEFRGFIQTMAAEYHGDTYHLITKNCNHFTNDICYRLVRRKIPGWINRLAHLVKRVNVSMFALVTNNGSLCSCLLPDSLQVTAVKQPTNCRESISDEDRMECLSGLMVCNSEDATSDQQLLPPTEGEVAFIEEVQKKE